MSNIKTNHDAGTITDPMDPALDAYRPPADIVDSYVKRLMPGGYSDVEYMLHLRDERDERGYSPNIALVGPTQAGKTMFVNVLAVLAAEADGLPKPYPVFTLNGSASISKYDLYGKPAPVMIDGVEVLVWMDGIVPVACRAGGILYLDEWNAVPPSQAVGLHSVLDYRRQFTNTDKPVSNGAGGFMPEIVQASTDLWIISTINPLGYKGVQAMAEATSNRFRWINWDYDEKVEKNIIASEAVIDFARLLRDANKMNQLRTPVGLSALYALNADLIAFGADAAMAAFLAMFQTSKDRIVVEEIIEKHQMVDRMSQEYDDRTYEPAS